MAYAGKILLDGTELRTVSPESLYETVSCPCPALRASSSRTRWNRRHYDGILVLKDGRIAESGSFDDLMAQKGYFYALYTVSQ